MQAIRLLILKIKLIWRLFKPKRGMFVKTCGICHGILFDVISQHGEKTYVADFVCRRCGATGHVEEIWREEI